MIRHAAIFKLTHTAGSAQEASFLAALNGTVANTLRVDRLRLAAPFASYGVRLSRIGASFVPLRNTITV